MSFDFRKNQTALHETGHVLPVWYFGGKIIKVTIVGPTDETQPEHLRTFCYASYEPPEVKSPDRLTGDDILFRIIASLAPYVVEEKFLGEALPGSLYDIQKAIRSLSPAYEDPKIQSLVDGAREVIKENISWEDATIKFFRKFGQPVKDFFDQKEVENAVTALTQYLSAKGSLTGFEAANFLESVWEGKLPEKAKPAHEHSTGLRGGTLANTLASTSNLIELIRHNFNECEPANQFEEEILDKAFQYVLESLFKIRELESAIK